MLYADLILPVPLNQTFTYLIPESEESQVQVGMRVMAPFGRNHTYTGIIVALSPHRPDTDYDIKPITSLLDDAPIIRHPQYPLWQWIADYYLCPIGDVMKAALPAELKPEEGKEGTVREDFHAKTRTMVRIVMEQGMEQAFETLKRTPQQQKLFMKLLDLSHVLQKKQADPVPKEALLKLSGTSPAVFNELQKKGLLTTFEEEVSRLDTGSDAYRQQPVEPPHPLSEMQRVAYRQICQSFSSKQVCLLHGVTSSGKTEIYVHLIKEVIDQGRQALLMVPEIALTTQLCLRLRRVFGKQMLVYHSKLSDTERVEIWKKMLTRPASGHTVSKEEVPSGQAASHFEGEPIAECYQPKLIVGVRSSIFLPFEQLGLIIVDEEHEPSYKQQDPAPRYNGRDVAIVLAMRHGAKVLLGSATPSLESYYLAQTGKYGLVHLTERHAGVSMPKITLLPRFSEKAPTAPVPATVPAASPAGPPATVPATVPAASPAGTPASPAGPPSATVPAASPAGSPFTPALVKRLEATLLSGKQAILFQNRRGYAQQVECVSCGWTPRCPRCDVTLTYHKRTRNLQCHYCGYQMPWPPTCPLCGSHKLDGQGFGTERIEETLQQLIPMARPLRMDTDTTGSKKSYERIIQDFEQKRANVLIGTQMVSKGLDFSDVQTVGILNADALMNFPDFRSHERAFQLMEQVAGRAGRRQGEEGEVLIQCSDVRHRLLRQVVNHDYLQMAETQLQDRQKYGYPPFTRLIMIYMKGRYEDRLERLANQYASTLRQTFGQRVLGPESPGIARVKNMYIRQILLKVEREASTAEVRRLLTQIQGYMQQNLQEFARIVFYYDVDPM